MKRILTTLCALAIVMAGVGLPAHAAEATEQDTYYPIDVKEYLEGDSHRISKVYQLSLLDDPAAIPTGEFERDGRRYFLLDMTRKDEVGVDTKPHTHTATLASDTDEMEEILQRLESTMEVTTEDGYTGLLQLDHTTVKVAADGYATKSQALSASRTYPNLSDADLSLIPKTIEEKGKTLTLADVEWASAYRCQPLGPGAHTMWFLTAWSGVPKILEALSRKYPDQRITYRWADEDIGHNVGEMVFEKGQVVEQDIPPGGSREAYEMAAEISGASLEDYGLYLSKDGTAYEYREEPVAPPPEPPKKKPRTRGDAR